MAYRQVRDEDKLPIDRKLLLTVREAAHYTGIGEDKISARLNAAGCPFALAVGTHKKLIKRHKFEEYVSNHTTF